LGSAVPWFKAKIPTTRGRGCEVVALTDYDYDYAFVFDYDYDYDYGG
jgi:hypothetical protein